MQTKSFSSLTVQYDDDLSSKWNKLKEQVEETKRIFTRITGKNSDAKLSVAIRIPDTSKNLCVFSHKGELYIGIYSNQEKAFEYELKKEDLAKIKSQDFKRLEDRTETVVKKYFQGELAPHMWDNLIPLWEKEIPELDKRKLKEDILFNQKSSITAMPLQERFQEAKVLSATTKSSEKRFEKTERER